MINDIHAIISAIDDFILEENLCIQGRSALLSTKEALKDMGNKLLIEDDRWKKKGGSHNLHEIEPIVCPKCHGSGTYLGNKEYLECDYCGGEGEFMKRVKR